VEQRLRGGFDEGAVLVDGTVRRRLRPWSRTVHHLLLHLEQVRFPGAPRFLGTVADREVLSYLPGETVGESRPWNAWVHSDAALLDIGRWLRDYHDAVRGYVPPADAHWREGGTWLPGMIVAHGDAAPYNAVWNRHGLVGMIDWDMAGPALAEDDLASIVFSWTPLHDRELVAQEGFTAFSQRRERVERLLGAYGWTGTTDDILVRVATRLVTHLETMRMVARSGDETYRAMLDRGVDRHLEAALADLDAL
jgi:hypothetical protein